MSFLTASLGAKGEIEAQKYLKKLGYRILDVNFRTRFGEIDIIAQKDGKIHFVEVKTRASLIKGHPYEAVRYHKIAHLQKAVEYYLLQKGFKDYKLSLDVISILYDTAHDTYALSYFENIS